LKRKVHSISFFLSLSFYTYCICSQISQFPLFCNILYIRLSRGRLQPFYNVLAVDGSKRYVAEENIVLKIMSTSSRKKLELIDDGLMGKYFLKWNEIEKRYTLSADSKLSYPDDEKHEEEKE